MGIRTFSLASANSLKHLDASTGSFQAGVHQDFTDCLFAGRFVGVITLGEALRGGGAKGGRTPALRAKQQNLVEEELP